MSEGKVCSTDVSELLCGNSRSKIHVLLPYFLKPPVVSVSCQLVLVPFVGVPEAPKLVSASALPRFQLCAFQTSGLQQTTCLKKQPVS